MRNFFLSGCSLANQTSTHSELRSPMPEIFIKYAHLSYLLIVAKFSLLVDFRNLLSFLAIVMRTRESISHFDAEIFIELTKL